MNHREQLIQLLFRRVCQILRFNDIKLEIMQRRGSKSNTRYTKGYINLKTKLIVLDIYTPKTMKPKSLNGLIRTIAHEIAHLQEMPFQQRYKGRWIVRQHYPKYYAQVEKNLDKIKTDPILKMHFCKGKGKGKEDGLGQVFWLGDLSTRTYNPTTKLASLPQPFAQRPNWHPNPSL